MTKRRVKTVLSFTNDKNKTVYVNLYKGFLVTDRSVTTVHPKNVYHTPYAPAKHITTVTSQPMKFASRPFT